MHQYCDTANKNDPAQAINIQIYHTHWSDQFWEPRLKGNIGKPEHVLRGSRQCNERILKPASWGTAERTEVLGFGKGIVLGDRWQPTVYKKKETYSVLFWRKEVWVARRFQLNISQSNSINIYEVYYVSGTG